MTLPAPNLDDRRFQDLVDEAKRFVQRRCPEWTDHNVSDPGVTMIELFASMVEQLIYRLNRVPDRTYVKFLELIGVRLLPPTDADGPVTFWLSAPQPETVRVPVGTEVATARTETEEPVVFTVVEDLEILPCSLERAGSTDPSGKVADRTDDLEAGRGFTCFAQVPRPGDALVVGLSQAVPRCAVVLRFDCRIEGVGVDPRHPPIVWEAWNGEGWARCEVERDDTGGFNKGGDVVLHVPRGHTASVLARRRAGWLRCRMLESAPGQPTYRSSPVVTQLSAFTIGGTTTVAHAELIEHEVVGVSEGVAGQRFPLSHRPVVASGQPVVLEVSGGGGWEEWTAVGGFGGSGPDDRHFVLDEVNGDVVLGPAVREPDGTLRRYGAVPAKGATLRVAQYRAGGGSRGNVARGAIRVLKSSIPYITRVTNRAPATGGVDAESLEEAKLRGPLLLRTRDRAVTVEDYETLAREAAPDLARVRCVPADEAGPGGVRLLIVPGSGENSSARLRLEELVPSEAMLAAIAGYVGERKAIGARLVVEPPVYQGITVVARVRARARASARRLQAEGLEALYRHFNPRVGGPGGRGWPFGRPVHVGEVYSALQRVPGVEFVEDARLFPADPVTGARGDPVSRLELGPHALVFSYEHQVLVQSAETRE